MQTIGSVISAMLERGSLPQRIVMRASLGPALRGDVAAWDGDVRGYRLERDPGWIIMAGRVRELWGEYFLIYAEESQPCLAL